MPIEVLVACAPLNDRGFLIVVHPSPIAEEGEEYPVEHKSFYEAPWQGWVLYQLQPDGKRRYLFNDLFPTDRIDALMLVHFLGAVNEWLDWYDGPSTLKKIIDDIRRTLEPRGPEYRLAFALGALSEWLNWNDRGDPEDHYKKMVWHGMSLIKVWPEIGNDAEEANDAR